MHMYSPHLPYKNTLTAVKDQVSPSPPAWLILRQFHKEYSQMRELLVTSNVSHCSSAHNCPLDGSMVIAINDNCSIMTANSIEMLHNTTALLLHQTSALSPSGSLLMLTRTILTAM